MTYLEDVAREAPEIVMLWDRKPVARKPHRCSRCGDLIKPGERYSSVGLRQDGEFLHERVHLSALSHPWACPALSEQEKAELAEQYERDAREIFGALASGAGDEG